VSLYSPLCNSLKSPCNVPRLLNIIGGRGFSLNKMYLVDFNFCDTERREMYLREWRYVAAWRGVSVSHQGDDDLWTHFLTKSATSKIKNESVKHNTRSRLITDIELETQCAAPTGPRTCEVPTLFSLPFLFRSFFHSVSFLSFLIFYPLAPPFMFVFLPSSLPSLSHYLSKNRPTPYSAQTILYYF
jgi:hypothetical protein